MNVTSYVSRYWTRKINVTKDLNSRRMFRQLMSILLMTVFCSHSRFENYQFFIFVLPRCHTVLESTYTHKKKKCIYMYMYVYRYIYLHVVTLSTTHLSNYHDAMWHKTTRLDLSRHYNTQYKTKQDRTGHDLAFRAQFNSTSVPSPSEL